ncbi:MAG: Na+/H+ antiporter NhaA [Flavobacteriales bacterium]
MGLAREAEDFSWRHLLGASLLAGIGFTMSLFIAQLAFVEPIHGEEAKLGILAGSLVAGTAGWSLLRRTAPGGRSA